MTSLVEIRRAATMAALCLSVAAAISCRAPDPPAPVVPERVREVPPADPAPDAGDVVRTSRSAPALAELTAGGDPSPVTLVAERAVRSVVQITAVRGPRRGLFEFFHPSPPGEQRPPGHPRDNGQGSGVIVSADGYLLTNHHVVEDSASIEVRLYDGDAYAAELVGSDPKTDLAVLRLEGDLPPLEPLAFGDSDRLRLGQFVLAIGSAFGLGQTVTLGIVSALGRDLPIITTENAYEEYIQTDAAINPGNSGGALVDLSGELVGISTAILTRSGGSQGVGFAIPANMARWVYESIRRDGRVVRSMLGIVIQQIDNLVARERGLPVTHGVLVTQVAPDGPARAAGLMPDDVIVALDGRPISKLYQLRNRVSSMAPGTRVELEVVRGDERRTIAVELVEMPQDG